MEGKGKGKILGQNMREMGARAKTTEFEGKGKGKKKMTMWPVKIWDQGKMRWKYLKNRCYQFKGQSSTDQKLL